MDARIFAHVLVLELDSDLEVRDAQGCRLPGVRWEIKVSRAERDIWVSRLAHARIVDYYDAVDLSKDPVLAGALSNAHTVRRLRGGRGLSSQTLIDTLQLGYDDAQENGYDSDDDTPSGRVEDVPSTVRDLTVCVRFDARHHRLAEAGYTLSLPSLDTLTIVFVEEEFSRIPSRCWSRGSCWSPRRSSLYNSPQPLPRWGFLRPLVRQLAVVQTPVTLVGLEAIPRALLGLPAGVDADEVRREFADAVFVHVPLGAQDPTLIFLSLDDYHINVGGEAFALATSCPGPPPSPPETPDLSDDEEWEDERMSKSQRSEWEKLVRTAARSLIRSCLQY